MSKIDYYNAEITAEYIAEHLHINNICSDSYNLLTLYNKILQENLVKSGQSSLILNETTKFILERGIIKIEK